MPEEKDSLLCSLIIRKPIKPIRSPVIKQSCGIGDSDGYPAFDVEAETHALPDDPKWGFRITGGAEFHMPITVFQVSLGSLAAREGICLGDIILNINDIDASQMTLAEAHEIINTEDKLFIIARGMEGEDVTDEERQPIEDKAICMRLPQPMKMPSPPKQYIPTQLLERKPWHPVMWQQEPPKIGDDSEEEAPHHRIIRNIRRFLTENENNHELRMKHIEDMFIVLPK